MIKVREKLNCDTRALEELFLLTRQQAFKWENAEKYTMEDYKKSTKGEKVFVAEKIQ